MNKFNESSPELTILADKIGSFIEHWGFKKIHGQIWTHIFLTGAPIDATCLVKRLGVSKALISLAVKDLIEYKVIQVAGTGDRGKIILQSNPDLNEVIINVLRMRERSILAEIMSSYKNLTKLKVEEKSQLKLCDERVKELGEMVETAEATLDGIINSNLTGF